MTIQPAWLPENRDMEHKVADIFFDYAKKETTFDLGGLARELGIDPTDIEDLTIYEREGYLPNLLKKATAIIKDRQNQSNGFFYAFWCDKDGRMKEELQLPDENTGVWYIKYADYIA